MIVHPRSLFIACVAAAGAAVAARAGLDVPPSPPVASDLSGYVTTQALSDAITAAAAAPGQKLNAVPTSGPGPGQCKISVVPSELITSGGVTGTPGTCSRIVQCGTSATYTVVQFNLGSGC